MSAFKEILSLLHHRRTDKYISVSGSTELRFLVNLLKINKRLGPRLNTAMTITKVLQRKQIQYQRMIKKVKVFRMLRI